MDKNQWNINISAWRWKDGGLVVQMKNLKNIMKTDKVLSVCQSTLKSVNLQFNMVGRRDDDMIVPPPSDGPMIIWIDWE